MTNIQPLKPDDPLRPAYLIERQALLMQVDALERLLGMPRTAELRKHAKETGFYEQNTNYTYDYGKNGSGGE